MTYFSGIDRFFNRFRKRGLYLYAGIVVVATVYGCYALTALPEVNEHSEPEGDSNAKVIKTLKDDDGNKGHSKDIKNPRNWTRKQLFLFLTSYDVIAPLEALHEELLAKVEDIQANIAQTAGRTNSRKKELRDGSKQNTESKSETKTETKTDAEDTKKVECAETAELQPAVSENVDKGKDEGAGAKFHRPKPLTDVLNDKGKGDNTPDASNNLINDANSANLTTAVSFDHFSNDSIIDVANMENASHSTADWSVKNIANTSRVILATKVGDLNRSDVSGHPSADVSPAESSFVDNIDNIEKIGFVDEESSTNFTESSFSEGSTFDIADEVGTKKKKNYDSSRTTSATSGTDVKTFKAGANRDRTSVTGTSGRNANFLESGRSKNEPLEGAIVRNKAQKELSKESNKGSKGTTKESTRESVKRKLLHFTPKRPLKKGESAPPEP